MVIHQEKNTQIEQAARDYAMQLFDRQGYRITKGQKGCDFVATKGNEVIPVEVKGRSKLINFTNMSKRELQTLREVPNARVILVYVNAKDTPQALIHLMLTKDDIASAEISTYRVKWRVPIEKAVMEEMGRAVEQTKESMKSYPRQSSTAKS